MVALLFLNEALELVSDTTIMSVFFGLNLSLYFLCVQLFYRQYSKAPTSSERGKTIFLFLYNSLVVLAAALEVGYYSNIMQRAYIDHGGTNGEPMEFEVEDGGTWSGINFMLIISAFVIGILTPLMQVWRTWVIWTMSPYRLVVTIPALLIVIAGVGMEIYGTLPIIPPDSEQGFIFGTTLAALTVAFNVLITLLLVGRIFAIRVRHTRLMGTSFLNTNHYTSIVTMLIESYSLDAIWSLASMICRALNIAGMPVEVGDIFGNTADQVTTFAFLLVNYRVLLGRAWTTETGRQLSSLHWNHDAMETATSDSTTTPNTRRDMGPQGMLAGENVGSIVVV